MFKILLPPTYNSNCFSLYQNEKLFFPFFKRAGGFCFVERKWSYFVLVLFRFFPMFFGELELDSVAADYEWEVTRWEVSKTGVESGELLEIFKSSIFC